ncbi:gag-pol polyprotein [Tanacetum coccineum]
MTDIQGTAISNLHLALADSSFVKHRGEEKCKGDLGSSCSIVEALLVTRRGSMEPGSSGINHGNLKRKLDGILNAFKCEDGYASVVIAAVTNGMQEDDFADLEIQNEIMKIIKGARFLMKGKKVSANLYQWKEEIMQEAEASVASHSPSHRVAVSWHQKLGHMSEQGMKILVERKLIPGLTKVSLHFCEYYVMSKKHRLKFKTSNYRSVYVLELVHSDVWLAPVQSLGGAKYFVSFIDDYSRRCWVYPIKKTFDVFEVFKVYKARVELDSGKKIKCLRTDNREWIGRADEQNLIRKSKSNVGNCKRGKIILGGSSKYRVLCDKSFTFNCSRVEDTDGNVDGKAGYAGEVKRYRLWDPTAHKVVINRDVVFMEDEIQENKEGDSTTRETISIQIEKEFQSNDSFKAVPHHEVNETDES